MKSFISNLVLGMTKDVLRDVLVQAKEMGIVNVLCIRGDEVGEEWASILGGVDSTVELIRFSFFFPSLLRLFK